MSLTREILCILPAGSHRDALSRRLCGEFDQNAAAAVASTYVGVVNVRHWQSYNHCFRAQYHSDRRTGARPPALIRSIARQPLSRLLSRREPDSIRDLGTEFAKRLVGRTAD